VHRELLAGLAGRAPLLSGAGQLAFIDMDSMQRRVYGHAKQGNCSIPMSTGLKRRQHAARQDHGDSGAGAGRDHSRA